MIGSLYRLKFNLRKVRLGIPKGALVMDIGSGNNPHPRADILCDKFIDDDFHRQGHQLVRDERIFIQADIERLPFKDKSIDFVIVSHMLEHVEDVYKAAKEVSRVGKKGYIEVPSAQVEFIFQRPDHKWLVRKVNNRLEFVNKKMWEGTPKDVLRICSEIRNMIEQYPREWWRFYFRTIEHWVVQYFWDGSIDIAVLDEKRDNAKPFTEEIFNSVPNIARADEFGRISKLTTKIGKVIFNRIFRLERSSRKNLLDLLDILQCPACTEGNPIFKDEALVCINCNKQYKIVDGIAKLIV